MMTAIDPVELAGRLIACPSVTPADGGAQGVVAEALTAIGFRVTRLESGGPPDGPIHNLYAERGSRGPHFAFAGHSDVVPPGDGWSQSAFVPTVRGGLLYGRGAVDMKGAVAAFVAAAARVPDHGGTLSLILTGDEEGPATHGTVALIEWMTANGIRPDLCLVGEPTSEQRIGDTVKIGRRGSVNMTIRVPGTQGHVAYPQLADNPIRPLTAILAALQGMVLDQGTDWFQPSNLEVTDIAVGNPASNVIPGAAAARINIRFNDLHQGQSLVDTVRAVVARHAPAATVDARISGEAFLTRPGAFSTLVADAVAGHTGVAPLLSTGGGTSDARFLSRLCPVVELGLVNATMHKLDEAVAVEDLHLLTAIYADIIRAALPR